MRFALDLELHNSTLPIEYRKLVLSYIKNTLVKCNDGKYFDRFFKDTNEKGYCFSVILPKSKFLKDQILLENKEIKIIFTTDDRSNAGFILFNAFISQKNKPYKLPNSNTMTLKSISQRKREEIVSNKAIFKTTIGSGLCVRDHNKESNKDKYFIFNEKEFREKFRNVLDRQLLGAGFTIDEIKTLTINPIQCKKVVVKHYRRFIDTSVGIFELQGNSNILQYIYDSGIGSRKSSGFGMIDLVTQDLL